MVDRRCKPIDAPKDAALKLLAEKLKVLMALLAELKSVPCFRKALPFCGELDIA